MTHQATLHRSIEAQILFPSTRPRTIGTVKTPCNVREELDNVLRARDDIMRIYVLVPVSSNSVDKRTRQTIVLRKRALDGHNPPNVLETV
jgi:hypothetical protein